MENEKKKWKIWRTRVIGLITCVAAGYGINLGVQQKPPGHQAQTSCIIEFAQTYQMSDGTSMTIMVTSRGKKKAVFTR